MKSNASESTLTEADCITQARVTGAIAARRGSATLADLRGLPPTVSLPVAGRFGWGLSRAASYGLNTQGAFPCPVLRVGERFHVRTADLAAALGVDPAALLVNERDRGES